MAGGGRRAKLGPSGLRALYYTRQPSGTVTLRAARSTTIRSGNTQAAPDIMSIATSESEITAPAMVSLAIAGCTLALRRRPPLEQASSIGDAPFFNASLVRAPETRPSTAPSR